MNDPIADLLTRIRNASSARHRFLDVSWSRMRESLVKILKEQGYVAHYLVKEEKKRGTIRIFLKYGAGRKPVIQGLRRVSKPSLRRYVGAKKIPRVMGGMGMTILSTPKGLMDGKTAREQNLGGEVLCFAW